MPKPNTYNVKYEWNEDGYWCAWIITKEFKCATRGRTLSKARKSIRIALSVNLDNPALADTAELVPNVVLSQKIQQTVTQYLEAGAREKLAHEATLYARAQAVRAFDAAGIGTRETSEILGVSFQRVQKIQRKLHAS